MPRPAVLTPGRTKGPATAVTSDDQRSPAGMAFDAFYAPLLEDFTTRFAVRAADLSAEDLELDLVVTAAGADLARDLVGLCSRTLVALFHDELAATGQLPPPDTQDPPEDGAGAGLPTAAYQAFHHRLASEAGQQLVFDTVPVLRRRVKALIEGRLELLESALRRLVADRAAGRLERLGDPGRLIAARVGGDSHNGGRQVVLIEGVHGRLVYKPRSLATDALLTDLVAELNAELDPELVLRPLPVLDRGAYGWQAFVQPRPCPDVAAVRRYYRRVGVYLALFHRLGAGDLHRENVIACGEEPLFVDLETCWTRRPQRSSPASAAELFQAELDDSVLSTMLLPARVVGSPFDMNNAGIGALGAQRSRRWTGFRLVGLGSDHLRFAKRAIETRHDDNLVTVDGEPVDPVRFADEVDAGFVVGSELLDRRAATLRDAVQSAADRQVSGRQVLRATALYGTLLEASSHPAYLRSETDRAKVLDKLKPQAAFGARAEQVRQAEIEALQLGDVPYFTSALGDTGLVANDRERIADAYPTTLLDDVLNTLARRTERDTERDRYLIHMSLLTGQTGAWEHLDAPPGRYAAQLFRDPHPAAVARAIGDFMTRIALHSNGVQPVTWITPLVDTAAFCTLGPLNTTLYEGGGALLFLAQLAGVTGDTQLRELVLRAVLQHPAWSAAELDVAGPGGFTGAAGAAYLLREMAIHLSEPGLLELSRVARHAAVRRLTGLDGQQWDLVGGAAGAALALLAATTPAERDEDPALSAGLARLAALLPGPRAGADALGAGAAHGGSGAVLAAARLAVAFGDDRQAHSAREAVESLARERSVRPLSPADRSTWCRGLGGDLPTLAHALAALGVGVPERIDVLHPLLGPIREALIAPVSADLSLCHGEAGLIIAGQELDQLGVLPGGRVLASHRLRAAATQAWSRGYRGGLRHSAGLVTFMTGLTGFGHAALRDTGPVVPSALTFERTADPGAGGAR